ncbi:MAG: SIR2 family protein [Rhodospirillales bacterium]|nr:SIR2 family protein [Rhodospirillales bacterium]
MFWFDRGVGMEIAPPLAASREGTSLDGWPNYQIIVPQLLRGAVVPFLGAGASMFHRRLLNEPTLCPPSATELAERFATTTRLPRDSEEYEQIRSDLPRAASYFEHVTLDRDGLNDELKAVFDLKFEPNTLHHVLARVAAQQNLLVITTNYDDMIERAFELAKVPYHLVVTAIEDCQVKYQEPGSSTLNIVDPQMLKISLRQASIIYKMHGSICRAQSQADSQFVITEEDYVSFLGRVLVPPAISALFMTRRFLFLGYSLRDWNFRVMLSHHLQDAGRLKKSWGIQSNPNLIEKKLWEKKNVEIFDMDLLDFSRQLSDEIAPLLPAA